MGNVYYRKKVNIMSQVHISYSETVAKTGETIRFAYHEEDDMLEVFLAK